MRSTRASVGGVGLALLFTACSSDADPATTSIATTTESPPSETSTTIEAPPAATSTTSAAEPSVTTTLAPISLPEPGEPWDVIFLSEVNYPVTDLGAELYVEQAQAALGVELRVTDTSWLIPRAWELDRQIRDEADLGLAAAVAESEVIIVQAQPGLSYDGGPGEIDIDSDNCQWETDGANLQPPDTTLPAYWWPYRQLLDQVYSQIWALRQGAPTLLIGLDVHHSLIDSHQQAGIAEECRTWYEAWGVVMRETAEAHGARWVSVYDVLNGPDHDQDPIALGYIGPSEELPEIPFFAPNEIGSQMVADAIASVGFEPVVTTPMRIAWDGEACTFAGPAEMEPGRVTIDIVNTSETDRLIGALGELRGDHTVQDLIDYIGPEPGGGHGPGWMRSFGTWDYPAEAGETSSWAGVLAAGSYAMVCIRVEPWGLWFGGGFTVGAA